MKIVVLCAAISPESAAGHVILSLILTAWDIRVVQRARRSGPWASLQVTGQGPT